MPVPKQVSIPVSAEIVLEDREQGDGEDQIDCRHANVDLREEELLCVPGVVKVLLHKVNRC